MTTPSKRGFAAWSPEQRKAAQSKGGKASAGQLRGFAVSSEKAKEAGRKGGLVSRKNKLTATE